MIINAEFWVFLSFLALIALTGKKAWGALSQFLDKRIREIIRNIEEARHLKEEATDLLDQAVTLQSKVNDQIQETRAYAKTEIQHLKETADREVEAHLKFEEYQLQERTRLAMHQFLDHLEKRAIFTAFENAREVIALNVNAPLEQVFLKKAVNALSHAAMSSET